MHKTLYETLMDKANLCRIAARRTRGYMRDIWLKKAYELELKAANMPVTMARM